MGWCAGTLGGHRATLSGEGLIQIKSTRHKQGTPLHQPDVPPTLPCACSQDDSEKPAGNWYPSSLHCPPKMFVCPACKAWSMQVNASKASPWAPTDIQSVERSVRHRNKACGCAVLLQPQGAGDYHTQP